MARFSHAPAKYCWSPQADAVLSQANPVSTTLYEVLATTSGGVKIKSVTSTITWAVTQPTPLEIVVTVDGISKVFGVGNPISATIYGTCRSVDRDNATEATQFLVSVFSVDNLPIEIQGKSIRVQVRITWATTQPTPLTCRVKYEKLVKV